MIIPVGERYQQVLYLFKKKDGKLINEALRPTLFVPMTGKAEAEPAGQARPAASPAGQRRLRGADRQQRRADRLVLHPADESRHRRRRPGRQALRDILELDPGRGCRALQGFAIDGRKVHQIEVSCMAKGSNITRTFQPGPEAEVLIVFYDVNRAIVGSTFIDPDTMRGTFDWTRKSQRLKVPGAAREAIVNIGLIGVTGELSLDDMQLGAVSEPANSRQ